MRTMPPTPTPTPVLAVAATPMPSPTPSPTAAQTQTVTPTPSTALPAELSTPPGVTEPEQGQRVRSTLSQVGEAASRERLTLIVVLVPALILAGLAYVYLILRRR